MCDQAPFLNELILANQRTKFHFFFDDYWSRASIDYYYSGFDRGWEKNQRLVRKSRFFPYLLIF